MDGLGIRLNYFLGKLLAEVAEVKVALESGHVGRRVLLPHHRLEVHFREPRVAHDLPHSPRAQASLRILLQQFGNQILAALTHLRRYLDLLLLYFHKDLFPVFRVKWRQSFDDLKNQ